MTCRELRGAKLGFAMRSRRPLVERVSKFTCRPSLWLERPETKTELQMNELVLACRPLNAESSGSIPDDATKPRSTKVQQRPQYHRQPL